MSTRTSRAPGDPEIEMLSGSASQIYESSTFPPYFSTLGKSTRDNARLLDLHSLYHLCQMVLHCRTVPLFSGRLGKPTFSPESIQKTAATVVWHATMQSRLVDDYLSKGCDVTKISPMVAFASFIAASVLAIIIKSQRLAGKERSDEQAERYSNTALGWIQDAVDLLNVLQEFWQALRPTVSTFQFSRSYASDPCR